MNTLREEVETKMGCSPAKIGRRTPAWFLNQGPSIWRRSLKTWAALVLGFILGAVFAGVISVVLSVFI